MNIKEAIKLLKQEPDFSLSYYKREHAIDLLLAEYEKQQKEMEELKQFKNEVIDIIESAYYTAEPTYCKIKKLLGGE